MGKRKSLIGPAVLGPTSTNTAPPEQSPPVVQSWSVPGHKSRPNRMRSPNMSTIVPTAAFATFHFDPPDPAACLMLSDRSIAMSMLGITISVESGCPPQPQRWVSRLQACCPVQFSSLSHGPYGTLGAHIPPGVQYASPPQSEWVVHGSDGTHIPFAGLQMFPASQSDARVHGPAGFASMSVPIGASLFEVIDDDPHAPSTNRSKSRFIGALHLSGYRIQPPLGLLILGPTSRALQVFRQPHRAPTHPSDPARRHADHQRVRRHAAAHHCAGGDESVLADRPPTDDGRVGADGRARGFITFVNTIDGPQNTASSRVTPS